MAYHLRHLPDVLAELVPYILNVWIALVVAICLLMTGLAWFSLAQSSPIQAAETVVRLWFRPPNAARTTLIAPRAAPIWSWVCSERSCLADTGCSSTLRTCSTCGRLVKTRSLVLSARRMVAGRLTHGHR